MPSVYDNPGFGREAFVRVWPAAPSSGVSGNTLGFMRYLARNPSSALRVDCPVGFSLTLDRSVTVPNAVLGVAFERPSSSRSTWQLMFPGDTVYVPEGFRRFWIYNADDLDQFAGGIPGVPDRPFGYCGFLVGVNPENPPPVQDAPRPSARIFHAFKSPGATCYFGTGRMQRVHVQAIPLDVNGTYTAGSFTTMLQEVAYVRGSVVPSTFEGETHDAIVQNVSGSTSTMVRWIQGDQSPGRLELTLHAAVLYRLLTAFNIVTWNGAAVTNILYQVSGAD